MWPGDVNDVTYRKRARRILGIWEKSVSWVRRRRLTFGARRGFAVGAARDGGGGGGGWESQHRKIVYLSPYVEKPFHSNVIKTFVPELRSRKCFFVFRDSYVFYIWVMNILCTFHTSIYLAMLHYPLSRKSSNWDAQTVLELLVI